MMSGAIIYLTWLLLQVDGISSMMKNLATIIKGQYQLEGKQAHWGQDPNQ